MLKTSLAATLLVAALAAPAAHAQSATTPGHPTRRPPVRLWYRLVVTADLTKQGDFASPVYTDHRSVRIKLQMRSRTAVLLYRQCEALNVAGFEPKVIAQIIDLTRSAVSCDQVRAEARRLGFGHAWIRRAHFVEDVRFRANTDGFVDSYERRTEVPAHVTTSPNTGPLEPIDCPPQVGGIVRVVTPENVIGSLGTASAARDGVGTTITFPINLRGEAFVGSQGDPCHVRSTGAETLVPRLVGGFRGDAFGPSPGYGATPTPSLVRFNSAGRFGRSFTIESRESVQEPLANGTWVTSGPVTLRFELCDRGGRRASGC
jgi:hypothetical protein